METIENLGMTEELTAGDSHLSFGAYLKKVRIEKGYSIEDVMDYTRISKFVIEQIEAENRSNLPEDVFLKGFLKAYAEAVGVDPYDVLERYNKALGRDESSGTAEKRERTPGASEFKMKMLFAVVALVVVAMVWVWFSKANHPVDRPRTPDAGSEQADGLTFDTANPVTVETKIENPAQGLFLEAVCVEDTTLKISVDGGVPEVYSLKPEEHLELKAKKMYNILIDNTCGVTLFLNNNPVTVPGKCGQTVTLQLP